MIFCFRFIDVDECSTDFHGCDQVCTNTEGSYVCECNNGYLLQPDGRSCRCGGRLTAASGSFQTDGWPNAYRRQNFQCEWIIELPDSSATIQFTIDPSAFGIPGRAPACTSDHIEFFDGPRSSASSLKKMCGLRGFYGGTLPTIATSSSTARVVFTGSDHPRPPSRVGVKVDYVSILPVGMCLTKEVRSVYTLHFQQLTAL